MESEGFDRTSLALPGRQDELVRAVAAVNPRTVVVVNAGAPVELPWRDEVAAVLVSWFPGMEFGNALADVLLGDVEPGGRLPTTWPAAMSDAPVLGTTPTDGRLDYAEGLDIGHRAYLASGTEPAYWFGHGLGYTTWEYESIEAPRGVRRRADRHGSGAQHRRPRRGKQVVQVYASRPDSAVARPQRWLAGFAVVTAEPGQVVDVPVDIHARALRHWDTAARRLGGRARRPDAVRRPQRRRALRVRPPSSWCRGDAARHHGLRVEHLDEALGIRHGGAAAVLAAAGRRPRAARLPDHHRQRLGQRLGRQRPEPAGALRRPAAGVRRSGSSGRCRCGPTWARARSRRRAGSRRACSGPRTGRRPGSSRGRCPDGAPGERPAALLRFEFDVDRPVVSRPAARHRAGHLRGVPQRRAGRRRRADARATRSTTRACRCRPSTSPASVRDGAQRARPSSSPTAGSAGRSASPALGRPVGEPARRAGPAAPHARRRRR